MLDLEQGIYCLTSNYNICIPVCDHFHNEGLKALKGVPFVKISMFYMKMELWKFLWRRRTVRELIHVLQGIS